MQTLHIEEKISCFGIKFWVSKERTLMFTLITRHTSVRYQVYFRNTSSLKEKKMNAMKTSLPRQNLDFRK